MTRAVVVVVPALIVAGLLALTAPVGGPPPDVAACPTPPAALFAACAEVCTQHNMAAELRAIPDPEVPGGLWRCLCDPIGGRE